MRQGSLALLLLWLSSCASLPTAHVGPVTGLAGGGAFSCSQAGVRTPTGWIVPEFRVVSLDVGNGYLLVGGGVPAERGNVALYTPGGAHVTTRQLTEDLVYSIAIHPSKPMAAVGCADGSVQMLSLPDLEVFGELTAHSAPCRVVQFSNDGRSFATGGLDGLVYLYAEPEPKKWVLKEHTAGVECLQFHGTKLYSGARDGKVRLHNGGTFVRTYQRLGERVHGLSLRDDMVFAGMADGRVMALHPDKATAREVGRTGPLFSIATGAKTLIAGTDAGVRLVSDGDR